MADSIADILHKKDFDMPPEIERVKEYIRRQLDSEVGVHLTNNQLIITADNASLANMLRLNLPGLRATADSDKAIIIRIG